MKKDRQQDRITGEIFVEKKIWLSTHSYMSFPIPPPPPSSHPVPSPSPATIAVRATPVEAVVGVLSSIALSSCASTCASFRSLFSVFLPVPPPPPPPPDACASKGGRASYGGGGGARSGPCVHMRRSVRGCVGVSGGLGTTQERRGSVARVECA